MNKIISNTYELPISYTLEEVIALHIPIRGEALETVFHRSETLKDLREHVLDLQQDLSIKDEDEKELKEKIEDLIAELKDAEKEMTDLKNTIIEMNQELISEKLYNTVGL